jgi:Spy/CpxP family protein refolding chaperone
VGDFENFFGGFAKQANLTDAQIPKVRKIIQDYWYSVYGSFSGLNSNSTQQDLENVAKRLLASTFDQNRLKSILTASQWTVWLNYMKDFLLPADFNGNPQSMDYQKALGFDDDKDWQAIKPLVDKVIEAQKSPDFTKPLKQAQEDLRKVLTKKQESSAAQLGLLP